MCVSETLRKLKVSMLAIEFDYILKGLHLRIIAGSQISLNNATGLIV
jgi:hypothetical protein